MIDSKDGAPTRVRRWVAEADDALERLEGAPPFAKVRHQETFFALASDLMDFDEGVDALLERAPRFQAAGVFHGGPWEDPSRLIPSLVGASLGGDGVYPTVEALSMLRVIAIAKGTGHSEAMSSEDAHEFLGEVSARNAEYFFPPATEEARLRPKIFARGRRLFERLRQEVDAHTIFRRIVEEIDMRAAQRPILTGPIEELLRQALELRDTAEGESDGWADERLEEYRRASGRATELSERAEDVYAYRGLVQGLGADALVGESREFAALLQATGLGSEYHTVVLRRVAKVVPDRLGEALCLSERGEAEVRSNVKKLVPLINQAIVPATSSFLLGLVNVLERGLLSRKEVAGGLRKLADLSVRPEVRTALLEAYPETTGLDAPEVLLAGSLGVLGLPLGIGQGNNPTCQSARGISLWSQHAPGQLLSKIASVVRDGFIETVFEGHTIRSDGLTGGVAVRGIESDLDPVSQVLVPHLDRIYDHMMVLAAGRSEDGHRWVNPAMYGRWIQSGFASAFELGTNRVLRHESFVRRFFATHHPEHNDGHELLYPNPVGIMVTDSHARLLGRHAVSIQRVAQDPNASPSEGDPTRVYFFNPNNEGRQNWGGGVRPTVANHGERPGESSLPFGQFASRLYAFHFDSQEQGDAYAIPPSVIQAVNRASAESWGRASDGFA